MSRHTMPRLLVVFFLLLPFTILLTPTIIAQGGNGENNNSQPVHVPAMNFQPPRNAAALTDFLPANVILRDAPPANTGNPPIQVPQQPNTPAHAGPTQVSLPLPAQANAHRFNSGRVALVVEEGSFPAGTRLQYTPLQTPLPVLTTTNPISQPLTTQPLIRFQLDAFDRTTGQFRNQFDHPVRLVVDLRELFAVNGQLPSNSFTFWLAYRDENDPNVWHEVPTLTHQADGLLSAEISHFSEWAAGVNPERWTPQWNMPAVSEFSGAAAYSYAFETPPGRNGLQPNLTLSYNSRGLDGKIHDSEGGWIADGWSLAQISIVRVGVHTDLCSFNNNLYCQVHPNQYRLVLNGNGHELITYDPDQGTSSQVRFYAKDAPQLRITRYYDDAEEPETENRDRLFWIVETPDGTRYRLGFTADAEEWQRVFPGAYLEEESDDHVGYDSYRSVIAWHVDTVTDAYGNQMQYSYNQKTISEDLGNVSVSTRETRIVRIEYNYPDRIGDEDLPADPLVDRLTSIPGTRIALHNIGDDQEENAVYPITRILIFHGDMTSPIKEYRLDAQSRFTNNESCSDLITKSSALYSIRLFVNTDGNPHSDFQIEPTYALPPISFTYTDLPHFYKNNGPCFRFPYLRIMTNGYGGNVTFSYQSDNRSIGAYQVYTNTIQWPDIGYTYFVTQTVVSDGGNSSTTTYQYDTPCYGQSSSNVGSIPGAFACPGALGEDHPEYGTITGFAQTTITTTGYADETLPFRTVEFSQADDYAGMVITETVKNPVNPTYWLRQTVNTLDALWQPARFAYVKTSTNTIYSGSDNNNYLASKVENFYDATYQGGSQLGQLTQQDFYHWQNPTQGFIRLTQTRHHYVANTTGNDWLVRPWAQVVYDGSGTTRQALTLLYYDGATTQPQNQTLDQGELTLSRAVVINSPILGYSDRWYSQDTLYGYDPYGNQTQVKQNSDYGQVGNQGGITWGYTLLPGSSTEQVTTITYESGYNLYPVKVTNALNQETAFEIWGFKDKNGTLVNLLGFQEQRGLLKTITPPTGSNNRVQYEYDPFGRLHAVYDAHDYTGLGDTSLFNGNPVTIYRYWDNSWNDANAIWLNPAQNQPFAISEHTRPGEYNGLGGNFVYKVFTYYDGLGRPIQTQDRGFHPETVQSTVKDIVITTNYNVSSQATCVTVPYAKTHVLDSTTPAFDTSDCTSHAYNHTEYDDFGRPEQVFDPSNNVVMTYAYGLTTGITVDGVQRFSITRLQDANNHLVRQYHNVMGQLALVREYQGTYGSESDYADTRYSYDLLGNLVAVGTSTANNSQPSNWLRRSTMAYDALGRKLTMTDPDMGTWAYSYDALGNLLGQDANNGTADRDVLCFAYDKLNRLTAKRHDNTTNGCSTGDPLLASYSYLTSGNGLGQIDTVQAGYALDNFDYDSRGRVITHTRTIESQVFMMVYGSYDSLNRPHTVKYPGNEVVTTTYDREGENQLNSGATYFATDVQYNARGQMTNLVRPNVTSNYSYWGDGTGEDKTYRLKTLKHGMTDDALPDFSFTYDAVGNIGSLSESLSGSVADSQEFSYDELNRLTAAQTITASTHYEHEYYYDRLGNIDERHEKTCTPNCGSTWTVYNYSYGSKPDAVTGVTSQGSYSYDASGNMTSRTEGGTTSTQTFDAENRLALVSSNTSPTTTSFAYDATGQRTSTQTMTPGATSVTTYYPFPGYEMEIQKQWQTGRGPGGSWVTVATIVRKTYFLAGQAIATRLSSTPASGDDGVYYILTDHLGSTRLLTSTSGTPKAGTTSRYLPYGGYRTTPTPNELTERGYTGHHENRDIGLTYMNARFFVPSLGRFASADSIIPGPTNPQAFNRYSYVLNQPLIVIDPSGHCGADTGNNAAQLTAECIALAHDLEATYGIIIYWPGREDLPTGVANDIESYCGSDQSCISQVIYNTQYHAWTRDEMMALAIGLLMYEAELGRDAMQAMLQGTSFIRGDKPPGEPAAGEFYQSGLPGFTGPSIAIYDSATVLTRWGFTWDVTWVTVHEVAHLLVYFANANGLGQVEANFTGAVTSEGPTSYARTGGTPEDIAESLTVYLWDKYASDWRAPHKIFGWLFGGVRILGAGRDHDPLAQDRIDFIDELFGNIQASY